MSIQSPPVHAMNAEQQQTAADPWSKSTDLSHSKKYRHLGDTRVRFGTAIYRGYRQYRAPL